jgi:SAM-dependent methyltransferase
MGELVEPGGPQTDPATSDTYQLHRDPRSSHQRIARFLRRRGRAPILDVGCASGQLGRLLADTELTLDGIEPNASAALSARPFYRSIQSTRVEDAQLPASAYPVVVCADVLEHTPDPETVLNRLVAASTADATFVISLPNVAHLAARLLLLAGSFPRHERGIFDRTHLHFYTRSTALATVQSAGLTITSVGTTPVPLEDLWPPALGSATRELAMRLQEVGGSLAPTLFAFQWLIVARRSEATTGEVVEA